MSEEFPDRRVLGGPTAPGHFVHGPGKHPLGISLAATEGACHVLLPVRKGVHSGAGSEFPGASSRDASEGPCYWPLVPAPGHAVASGSSET